MSMNDTLRYKDGAEEEEVPRAGAFFVAEGSGHGLDEFHYRT